MKSKVAQIGIGLAVSAGVVLWLILAVEWQAVWSYLGAAHYWVFIPVTVIILAQFLFRALRWRYLLPGDRALPLPLLFDGIMFGNLGNYLLPLRAGEFMRPALVSRRSSLSFSVLFASVVIERFFDLSMVLLCFGAVVLLLENLPPLVYQGAALLAVLAGFLFLLILAGTFIPAKLLRIFAWFMRFFPAKVRSPLQLFFTEFMSGVAAFKSKRRLGAVILLTVLIWLVTFLQYYWSLYLFDTEASFFFGVVIAVLLALGVAAPSAPGFVGPFQGAVILAFVLLGESKELGTAYAVLSHIHQYLLVLFFGAVVLIKYGLKLGDFKNS